MMHDEEWLARVSEHEATQALGTSHTATKYAVTQVAIAYHEHMLAKQHQWRPDRCPITQRPFFMWLEHPEHGSVPTYGGPFDSYTIPVADNLPEDGNIEWDDIELSYQQYDHDEGAWKNWVEHCSVLLIGEEKLMSLMRPDEK